MGAFETFHKYMGTGLILIWYLAVIVYLFMKEKRRNIRILFLHLPILILLVFFNPLFYGLYDLFLGAETYFRLLWLLPVTCTLAYLSAGNCRAKKGFSLPDFPPHSLSSEELLSIKIRCFPGLKIFITCLRR